MTPHFESEHATIWHGDCLDVMRTLPDASIDACVTDPPYDLTAGKKGGTGAASINLDSPYGRSRIGTGNGAGGFMGKAWDATGIAFEVATWAEVYRVLKPGGHVLSFGGTRTFHRMAVAIEDAGFEIRDSIAWLYGSGFPKSRNLDGAWAGWGTALKPAFEPVVVARKPLAGTVAANVLAYGTGALNIDANRIGTPEDKKHPGTRNYQRFDPGSPSKGTQVVPPYTSGRWPTNVVLDESQAAALDEQSGVQRDGIAVNRNRDNGQLASESGWGYRKQSEDVGFGGAGGASRFFYTAKASTDERPSVDGIAHPTVKPVDLMRWLVRLVTPKGGVVLEPFAGSGTTVEAAVLEGFRCIAIEREADYLPLIMQRISKPHAVGLDLDFEVPAHVPPPVDNGRRGEASAARRYTEKGGTNFAPLPGRRRDERPQRPEPDPASAFDFGDWEDAS